MSVATTLQKARERVARGWLQGEAENRARTRVCAAQAISYPVNWVCSDEEISAANTWLLIAAEEQTGLHWSAVAQWNDYAGRTQQEVLDTFDHAIKLVERDASLAEREQEASHA